MKTKEKMWDIDGKNANGRNRKGRAGRSRRGSKQ